MVLISKKRVEAKLLSSGLFGNYLSKSSNVYGYTELINDRVSDINEFLLAAEEDIFLIKNYPLYNTIKNVIEFCIKTKFNGVINDTYIECKHQDVKGTAYQKLAHYLSEHKIAHRNNVNSFMILVYDGNDFLDDTQTRLHVQNIRENYIGYNFRQLILEVGEFENVFVKKLHGCRDMSKVFRKMKDEGY